MTYGRRQKALKLFKDFRGYNPKNFRTRNFDFSGGLVLLGECDGVLYVSDKYGGAKNQTYIHKFNAPYPKMFCNLKGNILVIKGNFKILKEGITG